MRLSPFLNAKGKWEKQIHQYVTTATGAQTSNDFERIKLYIV